MSSPAPAFGKPMRARHFQFSPEYLPINHGAYGTFPTQIRDVRQQLQSDLEARIDEYIRYDYPRILRESRKAIAQLVKANVEDIVFVPNASTGYNIVLRNLQWHDGDYIIHHDAAYGSLLKTIKHIQESTKVKTYQMDVRFPCSDSELVTALEKAIDHIREQGGNPKMAVFDTIVSMPGIRIPYEALVAKCRERGVLSLVDGAHGAGHIPLALTALDADFFMSNLHKWLFVPRGCAMLHVPLRNQHLIRTSLPTSHGFRPLDAPMPSILPSTASAFEELFDFVGTVDTQNYLTVPAALRFREEVCGGEERIMAHCIALARSGGDRAAALLDTEVMDHPASRSRDCAFANVRLPLELGDGPDQVGDEQVRVAWEYITHRACTQYNMYCQVLPYHGHFWLRLSAQVYLDVDDFVVAADAAKKICEEIRRGEYLKNGRCAACVEAEGK